MILACLGQRQILKLGAHLNPQKKQFFDMKTRTLLMSSLFAAAVAFAQSPEKTKSAPASANFPPIGDIHAHVCGIHFYSGDMARQIIAEHYCSHLSDEVLQCVLYDSNKPGARLIGVEYIVSAKIFISLPTATSSTDRRLLKRWRAPISPTRSTILARTAGKKAQRFSWI